MIYLYGASGHAKVILEILEHQGTKAAGLFDDNQELHSLWEYEVHRYAPEWNSKISGMLIALGNNNVRKLIAEKLNVPFIKGIHPGASVSGRAVLGDGSVVMAGVTINADAVIGRHCIINTNASVDHDCAIEDYVHISPNVAVCGGVTIGEGAHIGAGAVIKPGIVIGRWATIGAGCVVIRDVAENAVVIGNPGKEMTRQ
ncbi:acetyltransferase [Chitinophaga sancti]|uniref:Acetyltransferase n=1 Tax=Chitinophaga sancti TaxID=1004 RepID=A0A1K1MVD6_9BACT|nr:acetyltransferase [Chitinophaga sancti]WQD62929.1 acetyltransferase [Chitinophaga sancti]WQG91446.1 acetyltransferase [Chitinophaga sancti]SFW25926.1 UDP-perosamine 4-acetyltransferase [Chitinophaga sancti]